MRLDDVPVNAGLARLQISRQEEGVPAGGAEDRLQLVALDVGEEGADVDAAKGTVHARVLQKLEGRRRQVDRFVDGEHFIDDVDDLHTGSAGGRGGR